MKRARWFLDTMVKPAFADWERDLSSEMRMRCVVGFVSDMAEWIWNELPVNLRPKKAGQYRDQWKKVGRFELIADIANGTKHVTLERGNPQVTNADQAKWHSYRTFGEAKSVAELDAVASQSLWIVEDDKGRGHPIRLIVEECIEMWEALLKDHGA